MGHGQVCVIEDETDILEALKSFLEAHDYEVYCYHSAESFYQKGDSKFRGVYLVDWNLPGEPGINIISKIRENDKVSSIFMLSAHTKSENILTGLKYGADDYITKPFSLEELLLRIQNAQLKLSNMKNSSSESEFRLLPEASAFIKSGVTITLTQREYIIFDQLYAKLGMPVSREELILVFDKEDKMTIRNIDVHIFSLRKKIREAHFSIDTVWGKGYKLV